MPLTPGRGYAPIIPGKGPAGPPPSKEPPPSTEAVKPTPNQPPIITGISPLTSGGPIFTYYGYTNGKIASARFSTPLPKESAERTVQVNIAFNVSLKLGFSGVPERHRPSPPGRLPASDSQAHAAIAIPDAAFRGMTGHALGPVSAPLPSFPWVPRAVCAGQVSGFPFRL